MFKYHILYMGISCDSDGRCVSSCGRLFPADSPAQNSGMQGEIAGCHGDGPVLLQSPPCWAKNVRHDFIIPQQREDGLGEHLGVHGSGSGSWSGSWSGPCCQADGSLPGFLLSPEMILLILFFSSFSIQNTLFLCRFDDLRATTETSQGAARGKSQIYR